MDNHTLGNSGLKYDSVHRGSKFLVWTSLQHTLNPTCLMIVDRDNTLIVDDGYVYRLEKLVIYEEAFQALRIVQSFGGAICIITNQGGIGLGKYTVKEFGEFNLQMINKFLDLGIRIDYVLACPHHPNAAMASNSKCTCRKPMTDMFDYVENRFSISRSRIAIFGDAESDTKLAEVKGVKGYRINRPGDLVSAVKLWLDSLEI